MIRSLATPLLGRAKAAARAGRANASIVGWPVRSVSSASLARRLRAEGVDPPLVIDVGSNLGQFAVAMLETFPSARVLGFEPLPELQPGLRALERRYGSRLTFVGVALGDEAGEITITRNLHHQASSIHQPTQRHLVEFPQATPGAGFSVPIRRLDQEVTAPIPPGSVLKLDVQGHEREVLEGGTDVLRQVDFCVIETSFEPMFEDEQCFVDLLSHMSTFQFRFVRPLGFLTSSVTSSILQMDALFVRGGT